MARIVKYVIWAGLFVIVGGFWYDIIFAGIPYQDAPDHLQIEYDRNQLISKWIMNSGLIITAIGLVIWVVRRLTRVLRSGDT